MDTDKLINKIKKLLALGESNNVHEASLALQRARKLMDEHKISISDIEISKIVEHESQYGAFKKTPDYVMYLVNTVALLFQCRTMYTTRYHETKKSGYYRTTPIFVGFDPMPEIASYTYKVLYKQMMDARNQLTFYGSKKYKTWKKDSFCYGWVLGVYENIKHMVPERIMMEVESDSGLVKIDPIKTYIDNITTTTLKTRTNNSVDELSYNKGQEEGSKVQINKAVNHSKNIEKLIT
jgi:hypothetical protein